MNHLITGIPMEVSIQWKEWLIKLLVKVKLRHATHPRDRLVLASSSLVSMKLVLISLKHAPLPISMSTKQWLLELNANQLRLTWRRTSTRSPHSAETR